MSIADPRTAPKRPDLSYLRHRSRPAVSPAAVTTASTPEAAVADFVHDRTPRHPAAPAAPVVAAAPAAATVPAVPTAPAVPMAAPPDGDNLLDLSAPAPAGPPGASPTAPVQPAGGPVPPAAGPVPPAAGPVPPAAGPVPPVARPVASGATRASRPADLPAQRRARAGPPTILTPKDPVVTLTRIQSGVGVLRIEAACSPAVGDLRLGCAYQLRSGTSSIVQYAGGPHTAPPASHRPVIIADRGQFEQLSIDLVQSRSLERLVVYAFSDSGAVLNWGGTLLLTTFGQARVELPLDRPPSPRVAVLMSLYNIDGEFVVRAEMEEIAGSVRDAVAAYGFDRITWLDQRTPLV